MNLRQLRYFLTVAEELHFSRAASRLHLAQSALSSQIRLLEDEIGGPLLIRNTRRVELTPAGHALRDHALEILATVDKALAHTRALARGEEGTLVIGSQGPAPGELLAPLLMQFSIQQPDVEVELRAFDFNDTVLGLREGRADLAFLYGPVVEPDLVTTPLLSEERMVVLPTSHRLAGRSQLRPADLREETFVTLPDTAPSYWRDFWLLADELGERPPVSAHVGVNIEEWLHLISRAEGIDTCPAIISRYYAWPDVAFVPLTDAAPVTFVLVRRAEAIRPVVVEFIREAVNIAATIHG